MNVDLMNGMRSDPSHLRYFLFALIALVAVGHSRGVELLNVSYDPTRELYTQYNAAFTRYWKNKTGEEVTIKQSHGGSGAQARSVIDGLQADVVTLALAADIDNLHTQADLVPADWQKAFPSQSAPYTSTIVFLVRPGNPKGIRDWGDLIKPGVKVIVANPKTSGGARWAYLAAWGQAQIKGKNPEAGHDFVTRLYKNVPVLDTGARGSTVTFAQRGMGDVLLAWENEAFLAKKEFADQGFEIVVPSVSILAEPPVAVVSKVTQARGTTAVAQAYLEYLYSKEGQEIAARNYYRPRDKKVAAKYKSAFPAVKLFTIDKMFGGWAAAQKAHFAEGGIFDKIYGD
jgi:sulfate/thiosulfate-binding protein